MRVIFSLATLILIFLSAVNCAKIENEQVLSDVKVLKIDEKNYVDNLSLDKFISEIDYTFLETFDQGLISLIEDIKFFEHQIFVHDQPLSRIFIFDTNGEMRGKVEMQGPGPGQYSDISFFDINQAEKRIEIFDIQGGRIMQYDFSGAFVGSIYATIICRDFAITKNGNYLFYSPDEQNQFNNGHLLKPGLIYLEADGKAIRNVLELGSESFYPLLGAGKSLVGLNEEFYLFSNYTDTVYTIKEDQVIDKLFLDFEAEIDPRAFIDSGYDLSNSDFPFLKLRPFVTENYLGYTFLHRNMPKILFYDLGTKELTLSKSLLNNVNFTPFVFNGISNREGTQYISVIDENLIEVFKQTSDRSDVDDLYKRQALEVISRFEKTQNPILALGEFKE